jgi:hypothetical protein
MDQEVIVMANSKKRVTVSKGVETVQNQTDFIIPLLNFNQFFKFFYLKSFAILPDFVFSLLKSHIRAALL